MPEDPKVSRSIADEIADSVFNSVETPAQIFFFALFVFGVITLAATTLVGPCGNVDDERLLRETRTLEYIPGAAVFTTSSIVLGDTVVSAGVCGIIESVNEEEQTARVQVLAKAQPFFTGSPEEYRPLSVFKGFSGTPLSTLFFLHRSSPVGEIPFTQMYPVATRPYTNLARTFYMNHIYIVMAVLTILLAFFGYVGVRYEKKRKEWYAQHTLRGTYISRLMRDRERMKELREQWEQVSALAEGEDPIGWKEALSGMNEILDGVLVLLRFEGDNLTDRLSRMKEKDLWTINRLWKAHSLILRVTDAVEGEDIPAVTKTVMRKVTAVHKESLIWLGLLPHSA